MKNKTCRAIGRQIYIPPHVISDCLT